MSKRSKLPPDVRALCIAHAQGYDRRKRERQLPPADRRSMEAVETALLIATHGIRSREVCEKLRRGILLSCGDRKRWPYERLHLPTVGRNEFYRRKADFLAALAEELGYEI